MNYITRNRQNYLMVEVQTLTEKDGSQFYESVYFVAEKFENKEEINITGIYLSKEEVWDVYGKIQVDVFLDLERDEIFVGKDGEWIEIKELGIVESVGYAKVVEMIIKSTAKRD